RFPFSARSLPRSTLFPYTTLFRSSKRRANRSVRAARAASASPPLISTCRLVPLLAASIITDMMFLPSAIWLLLPRRILLANWLAVPASLAAARACRPRLLMICNSVRIMVVPSRYAVQFTMPHLHLRILLAEQRTQLLGQIHRPVLAAGAADGDGQVTAVGFNKTGQPAGNKRGDVTFHGQHL